MADSTQVSHVSFNGIHRLSPLYAHSEEGMYEAFKRECVVQERSLANYLVHEPTKCEVPFFRAWRIWKYDGAVERAYKDLYDVVRMVEKMEGSSQPAQAGETIIVAGGGGGGANRSVLFTGLAIP